MSDWETKNESCADWSFTLNNYVEADVEMFSLWADDVKLLKFSKEVGESGTPHLQGRIIFKRGYRFSQLKKLHEGVHWKPTKCCADTLYVMKKDSEMVINRDNRKQGSRVDLDSVYAAVLNGDTVRQLWKNFPHAMTRYSRGILEYKRQMMPTTVKAKHTFDDFSGWGRIDDWSKSQVVIGESGIGKTQWALCHFANPLFCSHLDDLANLSEEHDGVIFDDMDFKHMPRTTQIHILDQDQDRSIHKRYENAFIPAGTKKIFTCNEYPFDMEDPAIKRRCEITHLKLCERSERKVILNSLTQIRTPPNSPCSKVADWATDEFIRDEKIRKTVMECVKWD